MAILTTDSFKNGRYKIPLNPKQETALEEAITYCEDFYLPKMFGVELYNLFIADLVGGVPTAPRFVKIFDPFNDQTDEILVRSEGVKEMLKAFVYHRYVRDVTTRVTTVGIFKSTNENAEHVSAIGHDVTIRYNEGVKSFKTIQYYMDVIDPDNYTEFEGVKLNFNHVL